MGESARAEILMAIRRLVSRSADDTFTPQDVIDELSNMGSRFAPSTIRTHVISRMCGNAPGHHGVVYDDLERVGRGRYRLRR